MAEPLTPLNTLPTLHSTQRKCGLAANAAPARFLVALLGSARPGADVTPSLLLPWLGPSFQHMGNITFVTESRVAEQEEAFWSPRYIFHSFMERLWAYLTIQQLLEQTWVDIPSRAHWGGHTRSQHFPRLFTGGAGTAGARHGDGVAVSCLSSRPPVRAP